MPDKRTKTALIIVLPTGGSLHLSPRFVWREKASRQSLSILNGRKIIAFCSVFEPFIGYSEIETRRERVRLILSGSNSERLGRRGNSDDISKFENHPAIEPWHQVKQEQRLKAQLKPLQNQAQLQHLQPQRLPYSPSPPTHRNSSSSPKARAPMPGS
jgi:hypothetical protein